MALDPGNKTVEVVNRTLMSKRGNADEPWSTNLLLTESDKFGFVFDVGTITLLQIEVSSEIECKAVTIEISPSDSFILSSDTKTGSNTLVFCHIFLRDK